MKRWGKRFPYIFFMYYIVPHTISTYSHTRKHNGKNCNVSMQCILCCVISYAAHACRIALFQTHTANEFSHPTNTNAINQHSAKSEIISFTFGYDFSSRRYLVQRGPVQLDSRSLKRL